MVETELKIPIPGTKLNIYATLRGSLNRPVAVFVHGLTGNRNEHLHYNGARFFDLNGYDSLRFNLYSSEDDARKLADCTIKTHAEDLDVACAYLRKEGVKQIFAIGHSYGGPTILGSRTDFAAASFWDAHHSGTYGFLKQSWKYIESINRYVTNWGQEVLIGKPMYDENLKLSCNKLAKKFSIPTKIIYAEKGVLKAGAHQYYQYLSGPKELVEIKNASHGFDEDGTELELFQETIDWFNKFKSYPLEKS